VGDAQNVVRSCHENEPEGHVFHHVTVFNLYEPNQVTRMSTSLIPSIMQTSMARYLTDGYCFVALTHDQLDVKATTDRVRNAAAGAIVLFAGMTYTG